MSKKPRYTPTMSQDGQPRVSFTIDCRLRLEDIVDQMTSAIYCHTVDGRTPQQVADHYCTSRTAIINQVAHEIRMEGQDRAGYRLSDDDCEEMREVRAAVEAHVKRLWGVESL